MSFISFSSFINYCLLYLIQLLQYFFTLLYIQPLILFLYLSLLLIHPLDLESHYFLYTSLDYPEIGCDFLWRRMFRLNTNIQYIIIDEPEPESMIDDPVYPIIKQTTNELSYLYRFSRTDYYN